MEIAVSMGQSTAFSSNTTASIIGGIFSSSHCLAWSLGVRIRLRWLPSPAHLLKSLQGERDYIRMICWWVSWRVFTSFYQFCLINNLIIHKASLKLSLRWCSIRTSPEMTALRPATALRRLPLHLLPSEWQSSGLARTSSPSTMKEGRQKGKRPFWHAQRDAELRTPHCASLSQRPTRFAQSEKFLDLGTVTRPPSSIYARVNCLVIRDWCTRVQGHPRNLFRRPWNFGLSSLKHHTWPYHASVLWYTEANFSFQMQQRNFPRPYLRNDTMDFLF